MPIEKKSSGVKSGERGAQEIGPPLPIDKINYLQMLKNYFYPIMQRKRLNIKMIFQQDGALPHFPKKFVHG